MKYKSNDFGRDYEETIHKGVDLRITFKDGSNINLGLGKGPMVLGYHVDLRDPVDNGSFGVGKLSYIKSRDLDNRFAFLDVQCIKSIEVKGELPEDEIFTDE